jgi:hypothetical protein
MNYRFWMLMYGGFLISSNKHQLSAAILKNLLEIINRSLHHLVARPFLGKVTKAHQVISKGYKKVSKKPRWGKKYPHAGYHRRVQKPFVQTG